MPLAHSGKEEHMEPALTIIIAIFASTGFWALIQKLLERKSALRQMVFGIGYERLISACREYIEAGWIENLVSVAGIF